MIEFGKSLCAAREAKGLTVRQLAELTRMAPTTVQELESENFSRIAAPIYGRGFVKLYCEAVGIDPKPLIDEFMEIYNGNHLTEIKDRSLPPETEASAPIIPETTENADSRPDQTPPPPEAEPDLFNSSKAMDIPDQEPSLSRYAAPIHQTRPLVDLQALLRLGTLAAVSLLLIGLLVWGLRAVYHATRTEAPSVQTAEPVPTEVAPATSAVRTPQKIPSLYLD